MNSELFDGNAELIAPPERAARYRMSRSCYSALARCVMNCKTASIDPAEISIREDGEPGCIVNVYGQGPYPPFDTRDESIKHFQ